MVVGCSCFFLCFYFLQTDIILLFIYLISKGIFHLGGLVFKMAHQRLRVILRNGSVLLLFSFIEYKSWDYEYSMHTLNILSLNVNGLNSAC